VALVLLAGCAAGPVGAAPAARPVPEKDETSPYLWKPKVTSAAVFKNGLGFFMREGAVALRDGWCLAPQAPPAVFGTLAVFAHEEDQFVDIVGSGPGEVVEFDGVDAPKDAAAVRARLEECRYLKVELKYKQDSSERTAAGTLQSVGPDYAILESDSSTFAVPLEGIKRLQVLDLPVRVHVAADAGRKADRTKLGMAYLRKGITWLPEYTLKILDDDTAELVCRGTLVNEAEDLIHADVHFVVGVPHFVHTQYLAPIAVGQVIRTVGAAVAPREIQTQIMQRAAIVRNEAARAFDVVTQPAPAEGGDLGRALGGLPQIEAAAGTDFTVYTKKDLTVRCGEKAIVTLFRKTIRYGHIYRWNVPGTMQHFLVLHNSTDTAWTTGPYLAISQGQPLSEDLLKYVPKGGSGEVPVTAAINIAQDQTETEVDRKLKAHSPSHDYYLDLVTLRGELALKNLEKREVLIVITASLPGIPTEASDDGAITVDTSKLKVLERAGSVRWHVKLKPGETKKLSYSYQRYVPSR
jgi:hypothetical protein